MPHRPVPTTSESIVQPSCRVAGDEGTAVAVEAWFRVGGRPDGARVAEPAQGRPRSARSPPRTRRPAAREPLGVGGHLTTPVRCRAGCRPPSGWRRAGPCPGSGTAGRPGSARRTGRSGRCVAGAGDEVLVPHPQVPAGCAAPHSRTVEVFQTSQSSASLPDRGGSSARRRRCPSSAFGGARRTRWPAGRGPRAGRTGRCPAGCRSSAPYGGSLEESMTGGGRRWRRRRCARYSPAMAASAWSGARRPPRGAGGAAAADSLRMRSRSSRSADRRRPAGSASRQSLHHRGPERALG